MNQEDLNKYISELFAVYDKNHTGFFDTGELHTFLNDLNKKIGINRDYKISEVADLYKEFDANKSQLIDRDELAGICAKIILGKTSVYGEKIIGFINELFVLYDQDKTGNLGADELYYFLNDLNARLGIPKRYTMAEVADILKENDTDKNHFIEKGQLLKMCHKMYTSLPQLPVYSPPPQNFDYIFYGQAQVVRYVNEVFSIYDKNHTGRFDTGELHCFLNDLNKRIGINKEFTLAEVADLYKEFDTNKSQALDDQLIDKEELTHICMKVLSKHQLINKISYLPPPPGYVYVYFVQGLSAKNNW